VQLPLGKRDRKVLMSARLSKKGREIPTRSTSRRRLALSAKMISADRLEDGLDAQYLGRSGPKRERLCPSLVLAIRGRLAALPWTPRRPERLASMLNARKLDPPVHLRARSGRGI